MPNAAGVVQKNNMNVTDGRHIHNYSTFNDSLSYKLYNTLRFAEYTPSFEMEGVENDEISLNTKDIIDSLSLKAPFKGSIRKIKESFKVPNMAILPMNWDKIYVQPSNGDDVPDDANCVIENFPERFKTFWLNCWGQICSHIPSSTSATLSSDIAVFLTSLVRVLVLGEYVYSNGSLLNVCGYKGSAQFMYVEPQQNGFKSYSYDWFFDQIIYRVFSLVEAFQYKSSTTSDSRLCLGLYVPTTPKFTDDFIPGLRYYIDLVRENPMHFVDPTGIFSHSLATDADFATELTNILSDFPATSMQFILPSVSSDPYITDDFTDPSPTSLNLSRLLAYQLVCHHFYTNSSVDFVYSAELFRQYYWTICKAMFSTSTLPDSAFNFTWNGQSISYDYLSGRVISLTTLMQNLTTVRLMTYPMIGAVDPSVEKQVLRFVAFASIFSFRRALRYGDYFVGSRPRPLAPINTDVAVSNNSVSVIDITRKIQSQRFANSVMRSRQKIENYVKSLFGHAPAPDYHNPFFLSREAEIIYGDEVQNTADAQQTDANSRTANFAAGLGQFTFTFHNDDNHPCIYLQIISFDVKRAYTRSVDRAFLHVNRYDMFNPDFQYIGDQPVYGIELGCPDSGGAIGITNSMPAVFAYQGRDMEYKQRFDVCCSGFVENLPGWVFTDKVRGSVVRGHIDGDFIRSFNTELDPFFLSLTGYSLGSYFHFTCITHNNVNAKRAMAVDPQILA